MARSGQKILHGGMIGGAEASLIGPAHRSGIEADGRASLTAGVFSRSYEKSLATARAIGMDETRVYRTFEDFMKKESARTGTDRLDWVSVVTPNVDHFHQIRALVQAGFNVIADKPLTTTLAEAEELYQIVQASGRFFGLTHTNVGYDAVKRAREMVRSGQLGNVHKIVVEYFQGWMLEHLASDNSGGMPWRTQKAISGDSCTTADIGTHAAHLAWYVGGLPIRRLLAGTRTFVPANELEDDVSVIIDYADGARGVLLASQSSTGEGNSFVLRVYGDQAALEWHQSDPGVLTVASVTGEKTILSSDDPAAGPPQAFAALYRESFRAIEAREAGTDPGPVDMPGIEDGLFGMRFVDCVLRSAAADSRWVEWPTAPRGGSGYSTRTTRVP